MDILRWLIFKKEHEHLQTKIPKLGLIVLLLLNIIETYKNIIVYIILQLWLYKSYMNIVYVLNKSDGKIYQAKSNTMWNCNIAVPDEN